LDALIELNHLVGDSLAKQLNHSLALVLGNGVHLGLVVVKIVVGLVGGGDLPVDCGL
jgi:hypothetical protein